MRGKKYAAIAFLGRDAPELLALGDGDLLVCNAGDAAIRSGATSPEALKEFLRRGIALFSSPTLHAKMVATPRVAMVGSANASATSTASLEAVVRTNEPAAVKKVRSLIKQIITEHASEIGEDFIAAAEQMAPAGERALIDLPGVVGLPPEDERFLPRRTDALWVDAEEPGEYPAAAERVAAEQKAEARRRLMRSKYELVPWLHEGTSCPYSEGDVIVLLRTAGSRRSVNPPGIVESVRPVPRSRGKHMILLRYRREDRMISRTAVRQALGEELSAALDKTEAGTRITDPELVEVLLGLWGLPEP